MPSQTTMRRVAKAAGYEVVRGAYTGTCDDRADRWYIQHDDDNVVDRRGSGFGRAMDAWEAAYLTATEDRC